MSPNVRPVAVAALVSAALAGLQPAAAQDGGASAIATPPPPAGVGVVEDWSSRSIVHGNPLEAMDVGTSVSGGDAGRSRYRDPRFLLAQVKRLQAMPGATPNTRKASTGTPTLSDRRRGHPPSGNPDDASLLRDWSHVLGGGPRARGGRGGLGQYPAKYTFDVLAAPSCDGDFVVYPTNAAGSNAGGTQETRILTMSGGRPAGTINIGARAPRQVVLTAASDNTGFNFDASGGSDAAEAASLAAAVNRWSHQTGISAAHDGAGPHPDEVRLIVNTTGNDFGAAPVTENMSNLAQTGIITGAGPKGQPTLIAFNQLYQGTCNGPWNQYGAIKAPNVMWAYNTGTDYIAETSPVLSYRDGGKQVAFVQRNGDTLQLVLLKWGTTNEGTPGFPVTPGIIASDGASYAAQRGNPGSVMHAITLSGTSNTGGTPTRSSPYVDYATDTLWVGDGNGQLHKFTGVFEGTPQEVVGGGFPAPVAPGLKLSSPVAYAGQVYVGSQSGGPGIGGKLHRVDAGTGAVVSSDKLAEDNSTGVLESPIVTAFDSGTSIYTFVFNDGYTRRTAGCDARNSPGNSGCRQIARFDPGFAEGDDPVQVVRVGRGNNLVSTLHAGGFDEAFYASADGTGAMYIAGGTTNTAFQPTLWKIKITAGAMGVAAAGGTVGNNNCNTTCLTTAWDWSPVTVFQQGGRERLYVSIGKDAARFGACNTGDCLFMYDLGDLNANGGAADAWGIANRPSAALATYGGTGGIIVDNSGVAAGTAQVYFAHGGNSDGSGNAVQASQAALD